MKIAFITSGVLPVPSIHGGAVETLLDALAKENEKSKNLLSFTFYTIGDSKTKAYINQQELTKTKYEILKIPLLIKNIDKGIFFFFNDILHYNQAKKFRFTFQRLYFIWRCHQKIKRRKEYDKVIIVNHPTLLNSIKRTDYLSKNKIIYYAHNDVKFSDSNLKLFKKCAQIISVSDYLNESLKKEAHIEKDSNKFCVVKNGIDLELFYPYSENRKNVLREQFGYSSTDILILFAGRLVPEKGIHYIVKAVSELSEKNKNIKLIAVGANSFNLKVQTNFEKQLIESVEGKKNILFTGFISNSNLPDYYNMADIVVLPSVWEEPAGLTMIEALACGKPLITTNAGGISEYVAGSGAIQLNPKNSDFYVQLKNTLLSLIENDITRKELEKISLTKISTLSYKEFYKNFCKKIQGESYNEARKLQ